MALWIHVRAEGEDHPLKLTMSHGDVYENRRDIPLNQGGELASCKNLGEIKTQIMAPLISALYCNNLTAAQRQASLFTKCVFSHTQHIERERVIIFHIDNCVVLPWHLLWVSACKKITFTTSSEFLLKSGACNSKKT